MNITYEILQTNLHLEYHIQISSVCNTILIVVIMAIIIANNVINIISVSKQQCFYTNKLQNDVKQCRILSSGA